MTEERQAVKTLAEQLVKAMKSVSANAPSKNYTNGTTPSTISASKIVGLPAAFSSIINGVEDAAAGGDAVAQMTLHALNHIAAGEFETITADTANIEKIYATFGDFITLVAEDATIGDLDVETIRAGLAEVGLINIGSASIDMAQIKRSSTQTAFIHESVQGKVYIDDLAVNDASIVNLSAGTVLINDNNGNLVELYVDSHGDVSTRTVSYDGSDIINQNSLSGNTIINNTLSGDAVVANSLNGNKIVSGSITTTQLNASEIFAAQGTIMEFIADNINVTRLFANQGFIQQLHTSIIGSDLSENSSIISLTDEINLMSSNTSRTFIQGATPFPVHLSDTWFDPATEDHYIAAGITISNQQMQFGHDDAGNLSNISTEDYEFAINSNGELAVLIKDEDLEDIITEHNVDFGIKEGGYLSASGLWNKIRNAAFSNLKISVDGIVSEVYDSEKGTSRIEQNADRIIAIVSGSQSVPYVKTNSIEIKEDLIEIKSSGNVDIKADNFSVSFNTEGSLPSKSRVDINNDVGIRVSDRYGGYFQANYNKIGLYDMQNTPRLYMDADGQAFFNGSLTLGGVRNTDGSLIIRNENGARILFANKNGMEIYNSTGIQKQFYLDSSTGNATFAGVLNAAGGTFAGELRSSTVTSGAITVGGSSGGQIVIKNSSNATTGIWGAGGFTLYNSNGTIPQVYLDGNTGNVTFAGSLSASCITSGTMTADHISGGTLTLGWIDSTYGKIVMLDTSGNAMGQWDHNGIKLYKAGTQTPQFYVDGNGNVAFAGSLSAASGTFAGNISVNYHARTSSLAQEWEGNISIGENGFVINSHMINDPLSNSKSEIMLSGNQLGLYRDYDYGSGTSEYYSKISNVGGVHVRGTGGFDATLHTYSDTDKRQAYLCPFELFFKDRSGETWFDVTENTFFTSATKSRLIKTDNYSDRLLYCYETPSPMFGDVGEGVISPDGQCYIPLDPIFAQTVSTDQYQVFLQRYGEGDCYVSERHGSYFVVAGTPNLSFGWEIKAKQSDFDQLRLERNDEKFSVPDQTYGEDAAAHIQELYNERTQQDTQQDNQQDNQESEE